MPQKKETNMQISKQQTNKNNKNKQSQWVALSQLHVHDFTHIYREC